MGNSFLGIILHALALSIEFQPLFFSAKHPLPDVVQTVSGGRQSPGSQKSSPVHFHTFLGTPHLLAGGYMQKLYSLTTWAEPWHAQTPKIQFLHEIYH